MAGKVLKIKVCSPIKLHHGLTRKYHTIFHYSYNLPLPNIKRMNIIKMTSKLSLLLFISIVFLMGSCKKNPSTNASSVKLWYLQPANATVIDDPNGWKDDTEWLKALPLGNGALGAMVFGDVNKERIQLNEESMWSGSQEDNDNPDAYPAQAEIRKLLFEGKYEQATELTQKTQICKGEGTGHGNGANVPFGCFQTLGDLWIDFEIIETAADDRR